MTLKLAKDLMKEEKVYDLLGADCNNFVIP